MNDLPPKQSPQPLPAKDIIWQARNKAKPRLRTFRTAKEHIPRDVLSRLRKDLIEIIANNDSAAKYAGLLGSPPVIEDYTIPETTRVFDNIRDSYRSAFIKHVKRFDGDGNEVMTEKELKEIADEQCNRDEEALTGVMDTLIAKPEKWQELVNANKKNHKPTQRNLDKLIRQLERFAQANPEHASTLCEAIHIAKLYKSSRDELGLKKNGGNPANQFSI